ncbi:hypothetical protein O7632_25045 [Solwaraspora sp. WMMD406]|uniref:hypothetical protein n=1 Tax=Solwaraspora sp. WMMD406 TaxID=3016095 RepID=UPI002417C990|nr:hypothetical protein [Solwaraspora sp. WMMD406]MDG4767333.1 hypothetical protein [Solwaraspora sp. WMMD406]
MDHYRRLDSPTVAELTDDDRETLKTAAFGAVYLVSNADPGVISMVKESFAASGAFADATGLVKDVLSTGPLPKLPRESADEVERLVLPALRRSVAILTEKAPHEVEQYRATITGAAQRVARAAAGIDPAEAEMVGKIEQALATPA